MSVLFCHDHRFVVDDAGNTYSTGQYSADIVARYERAFGEFHIAGREQPFTDQFTGRLNLLLTDPTRFHAIPNLSSLKALVFGDRKATEILERAILNVDVVVVRLPSEIGLLAASIARRLNKPLIVEVVACIWDGLLSHGSFTARVYAPLAYFRMRQAVKKSQWVLYVTKYFLQSRYPSSGEQVCASNVQIPPNDPSLLVKRISTLRTSTDGFTFGMIAAMFHNEKRVDIAIGAMTIASRHISGLKLEVVGAGDTTELKEMAINLGIGDHVHFLGVLPHGEKLFSWIDSIDCYVQTSFQEGLPRALIESMSRATPALASEAGGTDELLPEDWRHKRGDVNRLAKQMIEVVKEDHRRKMAEENFIAAADYTSDILNARRNAFWTSFCKAYRLPKLR